MSLSDLSIRRPVMGWMLMAGIMIFGWISFRSMGVSQLPNVEFPVVSVSLTWEGAAPEVMESDVVDIVEQSVMSVAGVKDISSSVRQGQASVSIELELGRDVDVAVQEIQTKIAQAQRLLPKDVDPPIVAKRNPADQPILWLTLNGNRTPRELMEYVQDHLQDQFASISGVGEVSLGGFVAPNLRVWVDRDKLNEYQLTVGDVVNAINQEHVELPSGVLETAQTEKNIRTMGEALTPEDFGNIRIPSRSGQAIYTPIFIKDVATVDDGLADIRRISRSNGKMAIGLGIRKQTGSNEVQVARAVFDKLAKIRKQLPEGMFLDVVINRTRFVEESIHELNLTLILSAVVTALVCWLFLGSWSATFNIFLAIPVSVLGAFIILNALGLTLNTFTILGLSLAIGMVVDDAIMVLENITRFKEKGCSAVQAASQGANQIGFAALASTIAIIAIFLPVAFMSGMMGKFFYEFGITISIAVAISLFEALFFTPMRCAQLMQQQSKPTAMSLKVDAYFDVFRKFYYRILSWALGHRAIVVIAAIVFFMASMLVVNFLPKEFVPSQDQRMFMCTVRTPPGSSIEYTDEQFKLVEQFLTSRPEVKSYFASIGGFQGGEVNRGNIFINLKEPNERPGRHSQKQIMDEFRQALKKIPGIKVNMQDLSLSGFSAQRGFPIEITVRGPNWDKLTVLTDQLQKAMTESGLMVDVNTDYQEGSTEVRIIPDREKAALRGVDMVDIGEAVNAAVGGIRVGKYTHHDKRYDIRVRLKSAQRAEIADIGKLYVWNNHGEMVPLKDVINVIEQPSSQNITRKSRERAITVFANVAPGKAQDKAIDKAISLAKTILPDGYTGVLSGSSQSFKESNQSFNFVFLMGILVAYMVLASQFNSYIHPVTILMALPFSVSGALLALWIGGQSLNVYSVIGLVLLMGIVKKNSILLVEFTNQIRGQGKGVHDALLEACPIRLRPIVMTSAATIVSAIPPALMPGPGAEVRIPMALAVMGGVFISTLLTLLVVPCVYSLFAKGKAKG